MANPATPGAIASGDEKAVPEVEEEIEAEADGETEGEEESEEGDDLEGEEAAGEGDGEADGEAEPEGKPTKSKLKRERFKARLAELERSALDAMSRAEVAERRLAELKDELGPVPKIEDFPNEHEFVAALSAYRADERMVMRQRKSQETATTEAKRDAGTSRQTLFRERALALADRFPDIEARIFTDANPVSQAMAEVLQDSERGPEVAYHLATHLEEARRIFAMPPLAAARELGRIEATLTAPKPRTQTQAPPPVKIVSGGTSRVAKNPAQMNDAEYRKWRDAGGGA